jgi:hypothetical protein
LGLRRDRHRGRDGGPAARSSARSARGG